jgi:hypothetical protein
VLEPKDWLEWSMDKDGKDDELIDALLTNNESPNFVHRIQNKKIRKCHPMDKAW